MHLEIQNGSKSYEKETVFDDISLSFPGGQIYAVLGINGAGKTTLLETLYGMLRLNEGEVLYDGQPYDAEDLDHRRKLFYLPSTPPNMGVTGLDVITRVIKTWQQEKNPGLADSIIDRMKAFAINDLAAKPLSQLSRGQQYKFYLTAYLSLNADVWFIDEPFSAGIDAPGADFFRQECLRAASEGKTIFYTTQFEELVCGFANKICHVVDSNVSLEDVR